MNEGASVHLAAARPGLRSSGEVGGPSQIGHAVLSAIAVVSVEERLRVGGKTPVTTSASCVLPASSQATKIRLAALRAPLAAALWIDLKFLACLACVAAILACRSRGFYCVCCLRSRD